VSGSGICFFLLILRMRSDVLLDVTPQKIIVNLEFSEINFKDDHSGKNFREGFGF
jgi:hypothetical protein